MNEIASYVMHEQRIPSQSDGIRYPFVNDVSKQSFSRRLREKCASGARSVKAIQSFSVVNAVPNTLWPLARKEKGMLVVEPKTDSQILEEAKEALKWIRSDGNGATVHTRNKATYYLEGALENNNQPRLLRMTIAIGMGRRAGNLKALHALMSRWW